MPILKILSMLKFKQLLWIGQFQGKFFYKNNVGQTSVYAVWYIAKQYHLP